MSSFEEITQTLSDYEVDKNFTDVLAYAQSLNEVYKNKATPLEYDEVLADLDKLNQMWAALEIHEEVFVSGVVTLNDGPDMANDVFRSSDECLVDLQDFGLRRGKFVLHDTLEFDGTMVVSGIQEIKFAGLVDIAKLLGGESDSTEDEDDDTGFDEPDFTTEDEDEYEEADEDQAADSQNMGEVWGLVAIEDVLPRLIAPTSDQPEGGELLEAACSNHFARVRTAIESAEDQMSRLTALSDLENIPEHREDEIVIYREVLELYLNEAFAFKESFPYIIQTDGQYARQVPEDMSSEFRPAKEGEPANFAISNPHFCLAYDDVGLPTIVIRACDLFCKKDESAILSIPLRSIIDIESTANMLRSKLDYPNE